MSVTSAVYAVYIRSRRPIVTSFNHNGYFIKKAYLQTLQCRLAFRQE